tara:strand:- start:663 stop:1382 length:720 start_codon:yes stop_codon:yes gene_type:complete
MKVVTKEEPKEEEKKPMDESSQMPEPTPVKEEGELSETESDKEDKMVLTQVEEPTAAEAEEEETTDVKMEGGKEAESATEKEEPEKAEAAEEKPQKKRKQRKPKKVELDEEGKPVQKKKRKLNHQCAAVKMCHALMAEYRSALSEEDQAHMAKFCQLNRGDQGIMFNKMCVTMRSHLKEKFPTLEKWEDIDFDQEDKKPEYSKVVNFLLEDYMEAKRKAPKVEEKEDGDEKEQESVKAE